MDYKLNGQIRNGLMPVAKWHCPYLLVRTSIVVPSALAMRAMAETDPDLRPRSISERQPTASLVRFDNSCNVMP